MFGETCRIKLYDPVQECVGFLVLSSEHIKYIKYMSQSLQKWFLQTYEKADICLTEKNLWQFHCYNFKNINIM